MAKPRRYRVWIEAEGWASGAWTPEDDNTDVIVTFDDGEAWVATFFSYQISRLRALPSGMVVKAGPPAGGESTVHLP
jgi:hypothetical protein